MAAAGDAGRRPAALPVHQAQDDPEAALPWPPVLTAYLEHLRSERRLAARTLIRYQLALDRLLAGVAAPGTQGADAVQLALRAATPSRLRAALSALHEQGWSARTVAHALSVWRGFFLWWVLHGGPAKSPLLGVKAPRFVRPLPSVLSVDQAVGWAQAASSGGQKSGPDAVQQARDALVLELLYGTGMRISELVSVDCRETVSATGWLEQDQRHVMVLGKGGKRRRLPLGEAAVAALSAWLAVRAQWARPDEPALLVGPRGGRASDGALRASLKASAQSAGVMVSVHPHMLRHSVASHLLQSSGDLRAVQELLGHAHLKSTQVYTQLDFQHLAQLYDRAHPRARRVSEPKEPSGTAAPDSPEASTES